MSIQSLTCLLHSHWMLRGEPFEKSLVHAIESVVIDWCHQVRDVLKKSSAEPLLAGKNPWPLVEIGFWVARRADLESVVDQVGQGLGRGRGKGVEWKGGWEGCGGRGGGGEGGGGEGGVEGQGRVEGEEGK